MTAKLRWVIAIVGLLGANMVAMGVLAASAQGNRARVIPDYYARAIQHDRTLDEAARSTRLGWRVEVVLSRDAIDVAIHDRAGAPVRGRVKVTGHPRASLSPFELDLNPLGDGRYRAVRANDRGLHDLVIAIDTPIERDTQHVVAEVP